MFNYRFDVILSHKKFTGTDFGRYIYIPYIPPRRYAPGIDSAHAKCCETDKIRTLRILEPCLCIHYVAVVISLSAVCLFVTGIFTAQISYLVPAY